MDNVNNENIEVQQDNETVTKTLPIDMFPIFDLFAHKHCQLKGLRKGTPSYKENYDKFLFTLQHESYTNSLSTGEVAKDLEIGFMARNPSTPKIEAEYFDLLPSLFGEKGFFAENASDEFTVEVYERRLRSIVASLANLILETKYAMSIKRPSSDNVNDNNASSFEHKPDGKDKIVTVRNQYMRLFYATQILNSISSLFTGKEHKIENLLNDAFGNELSVMTEKGQYEVLSKKEARRDFVKYFLYKGKKPDILQNPMKRNPMTRNPSLSLSSKVFCPQVGIYLNDRLNEVCKGKNEKHLTPNPQYIKGIEINEYDEKHADMTKPCVFGSFINDECKRDFFLINGADRIKKALNEGYPVIDAFILDLEETYSLICPTQKTVEKVNELKKNYSKFKLANR